jgi:hypothetical protein
MSEDLDRAATKRDLADLRLELTDRMQALRSEMTSLRDSVASLRNSFWLQIVVPSLTLLVSLVIHYIFK